MQQLLREGHGWKEMLYLNFEDERLVGFTYEDFNTILECHIEMTGKDNPMLFLDEIHNIDGWEKFARRMADSKRTVWITGSNARMFSKEIMTTLGRRYIPIEVYPFSFTEFLRSHGVLYDEEMLMGTTSKSLFLREYAEYINWGGLPESISLPVKRNYLSSVYQKIYLEIFVRETKLVILISCD